MISSRNNAIFCFFGFLWSSVFQQIKHFILRYRGLRLGIRCSTSHSPYRLSIPIAVPASSSAYSGAQPLAGATGQAPQSALQASGKGIPVLNLLPFAGVLVFFAKNIPFVYICPKHM